MPGENYCEAVAVGSGNVPNFDALKRANAASALPATSGGGGRMPTEQAPPARGSSRRGYAVNPFRRRRRPRSGGGGNMRRRQQPVATTTPTEVYEHTRDSTWVPPTRRTANTSYGDSSTSSRPYPKSSPPAHITHSMNGGRRPRRNPLFSLVQATVSIPQRTFGFLVVKPVNLVFGGR